MWIVLLYIAGYALGIWVAFLVIRAAVTSGILRAYQRMETPRQVNHSYAPAPPTAPPCAQQPPSQSESESEFSAGMGVSHVLKDIHQNSGKP